MQTDLNQVASAIAGMARRDASAALTGEVVTTGPRNQTKAAPGTITPFGTEPTAARTGFGEIAMGELKEPRPEPRRQIVKTSKVLRNRVGLVKALFEGTSRYSIAGGLSPSSTSADNEWDKMADDYFGSVAESKHFDCRQEQDFYSMQGAIVPDVMEGGDCGAAMVRDEYGEPQLRLIPTERIGDGQTFGMPWNSPWRDGIKRDLDTGAPQAYRELGKATLYGQPRGWVDYPANEFQHVGKFDRLDINRPLPWLHHGKESCIDILDLNALEMASAKINAVFAAAITTPMGDVPEGFGKLATSQPVSLTTKNADGETETKETQRNYVNLAGGGMVPVLADGEEMNFFKNERPSTTFSGFIDWLVNDIAWGFGVPPAFVWAVSGMSGPNARLVLQQADWFFKSIHRMMVDRFCQPVWNGVIADGLNRGKLPWPTDRRANIRSVQWQGPQSMSIDKGRDGALFERLVKSGMMSRAEWHEMAGKHGRNQRAKIIEEIAEDIQKCKDLEVPLQLYFGADAAAFASPRDGGPFAPGQGPSNHQPADPALSAVHDFDVEKIAFAVVEMMQAQSNPNGRR